LELLHGDDDREHDDRDDEVFVDEGDEDGDRTGRDGADDGDERAEKDDDGDRHRERQTEDEGAESDAERVDGGDEHLNLREVAQGDPAGLSGTVDRDSSLAGEDAHEPGPDVLAVDEDDQDREDRDEGTGDEVP